MITVLCCNKKSAYKDLGLDCYDISRDAMSYKGKNPVIAHPPCRLWSKNMRHFSNAPEAEKQLAWYCFNLVRENGGILEHPSGSLFLNRFWPPDVKIVPLNQSTFGYPTRKATWLLMPAHYKIEIPFDLEPTREKGKDRYIFEHMCTRQRSETTLKFAEFLIKTVTENEKA